MNSKFQVKDVTLTGEFAEEIDSDRLFSVKEAYKTLRTNIMLSVIKQGCKKIIISSAIPGEGKTTTASNIAISMSQIDKKVLLIDADLRKPKVHKAMKLPNSPGLTNILSGLVEKDKGINHVAENLDVICAGITVPNPSEMLASDVMTEFLAKAEAEYDYIIIDTPPLNVVSDALPLIKQSDGVLLIVKPYHTNHIELQKAIKSLEFIEAKIIGFVMNQVYEEGDPMYNYKGKYRYYY